MGCSNFAASISFSKEISIDWKSRGLGFSDSAIYTNRLLVKYNTPSLLRNLQLTPETDIFPSNPIPPRRNTNTSPAAVHGINAPDAAGRTVPFTHHDGMLATVFARPAASAIERADRSEWFAGLASARPRACPGDRRRPAVTTA